MTLISRRRADERGSTEPRGRGIRRLAAYVEGVGPLRFVVLLGLAGGMVEGIPRLFMPVRDFGTHGLLFIEIGLTTVLWWAGAFFCWWVATRRRRWSVWLTAAHVTLGLALANLFTAAIGMVADSIATRGSFASALLSEPWKFVSANLGLTLLRTPLWFLGAAIAITMGRQLSAGAPAVVPVPSTASDGEAEQSSEF